MNKDNFIKEVNKLGININDEILLQLDKYYQLLSIYNKVMNLTTIIEEKDVYLKHFYDSLTITNSYQFISNINVLDIGTGAGFPGIVLAIFFPNINVYLLDSNTKRINFLNEVCKYLNLQNTIIINKRAEELDKKYIDFFDVVTSRAVANLEILSELCLPYVKINGYFIALKGNIKDELDNSYDIINKLNGKVINIKEIRLPYESSIRNIISIKKIDTNPSIYPRRYDKIKKAIAKKNKIK